MAERKPSIATGLALLGVGLCVLAVAFMGLAHDVRWIAQPFYAYAWWGYILALDGINVLRTRDSLLTTRRAFAVVLGVFSITFWFCFELLNLRFKNWYYVEALPVRDVHELLLAALFAATSYATVFLGIFETFEALRTLGLWSYWRGRKRTFAPWVGHSVQGLGALMAGLAMLFPHYLAPLIWGSLSFLVDPWNARRGRPSLLGDAERGDYGRIACWFVAGLCCGFVWESLNFRAPQKWIYTVRGLEAVKWFEMPVVGFLGFPALAFDSLAAASVACAWIAPGAHWEREIGSVRPPRVRWKLFARSLPLQVMFCALVGVGVVRTNVGSVEVRLDDLGVSAAEQGILAARGITRPRHLLRHAARLREDAELRQRLHWDRTQVDTLLKRADLYTFKGIGARFGAQLERIGRRQPSDLETVEPRVLHQELVTVAREDGGLAPRLDMVRVWVLESRRRRDG